MRRKEIPPGYRLEKEMQEALAWSEDTACTPVALTETEQYYGGMARKGWQLEKRGLWFSRFRRAESWEVRYLVELGLPVKRQDTSELPEKVRGAYEAKEWEYVTGQGLFHLFRAPEGSDAPEICYDAALYADTLKALKRERLGSVLLTAAELVILLLVCGVGGGRLPAQAFLFWLEETAFCLGLIAVLLGGVVHQLRDLWQLVRLCRQIEQGLSLDHTPGARSHLPRLLVRVLWTVGVVCAVLTAVQWGGGTEAPMPEQTNAPYLVLAELGIEGQRDVSAVTKQPCKERYEKSLLTEHWDTYELVKRSGEEFWLYQDVYRLSSPGLADDLRDALMRNSVFAKSPEEYRRLEIEGLDEAWATERLEYIAVRGDLVWSGVGICDSPEEQEELFRALVRHWDEME